MGAETIYCGAWKGAKSLDYVPQVNITMVLIYLLLDFVVYNIDKV